MTNLKSHSPVFLAYPFLSIVVSNNAPKNNIELDYGSLLTHVNSFLREWNKDKPDKIKGLNFLFGQPETDTRFAFPVKILKSGLVLPRSYMGYENWTLNHSYYAEIPWSKKLSEVTQILESIFQKFESSASRTPISLPKPFEVKGILQPYFQKQNEGFFNDFLHFHMAGVRYENLEKTLGSPFLLHIKSLQQEVFNSRSLSRNKKILECIHPQLTMSSKHLYELNCGSCELSLFYNEQEDNWGLPFKPLSHYRPYVEEFLHKVKQSLDDSNPLIDFALLMHSFLQEIKKENKIGILLREIEDLTSDILSFKEENAIDYPNKKELRIFTYIAKWSPKVQKENETDIDFVIRNYSLANLYQFHTETNETFFRTYKDDIKGLVTLLRQSRTYLTRELNKKYKYTPAEIKINSHSSITNIEAAIILQLVKDLDGGFGATTVMDILKGSQNEKMQKYSFHQNEYYGKLKHLSLDKLREAIYYFISNDVMAKTGFDYPKVSLTTKGKHLAKRYTEGKVKISNTKAEKEKFMKQSTVDFLSNFHFSSQPNAWKVSYIERALTTDGVIFYKGLVDYALQNESVIPLVEPILTKYHEDKYNPILAFYVKTKTGKFQLMAQKILKTKKVPLC